MVSRPFLLTNSVEDLQENLDARSSLSRPLPPRLHRRMELKAVSYTQVPESPASRSRSQPTVAGARLHKESVAKEIGLPWEHASVFTNSGSYQRHRVSFPPS